MSGIGRCPIQVSDNGDPQRQRAMRENWMSGRKNKSGLSSSCRSDSYDGIGRQPIATWGGFLKNVYLP